MHSIYRHTVNVIAGRELLAFHQENIPLTPLSVSLPLYPYEFALLSQEAEERGVIWLEEEGDSYCLRAGVFNREIGSCLTWEDQVRRSLPAEKRKELYDKILLLLGQKKDLQGLSDSALRVKKCEEDSPLTAYLREKAGLFLSYRKLLSHYAKEKGQEEEAFQELVFSLLGLGQGLTPSGDDFLTGMMLAFWICPKEELNSALEQKRRILFQTVEKNLERTNDISKAYLHCALEGRFGESYHALLAEEKEEGQAEVLEEIARVGHSSGIDTLNGLAIGLEMIRRQQKGEGE